MFDIFTRQGFIDFLYFLPALLISLAIHEFSHAFVAYKLGDRSQKAAGRLTLAPFAHVDWMGFLSIALIGIGWGKPVMVDDSNFKNRNKGSMLVSIAGPLSNFLLAIFITIILKIFIELGIYANIVNTNIGSIIASMLQLTIHFNIIFAVFNMIPIPPFDGSKVLYYFLPYRFKPVMRKLERYSFAVLIVLLMTNAYIYIIAPAYAGIAWIINFILLI